MKMRKTVTPFLTLVVAGAFCGAALAQEEPQVMPAKEIHDQAVKHSQEVVGELLKITTPQSPYDYIDFYLSGPVVVLTGFTTKQPLKDEAEKRVQKLGWVTHVVNEIEIVKVDNTTRQLRRQVLGMLEEAAPQSFPESHANIRIKVTEKLDITLVGLVNKMNKDAFEAALVQIKNLPLVESVKNNVVITS